MQVIEKRQIVDDGWVLSPAGAAVPPEGDVIVPLAAWNEHQKDPRPRAGRLAVLLQSDERPEQIEALLYGPPPTDDNGLAQLARDLDHLESEVHRS